MCSSTSTPCGVDGNYRWQEGANNLLVLPDEWDIPKDSLFIVDDAFSGLSRSSQNMLASKVISYEKEIVQLRMETVKAKEMTKASLQELLITRRSWRRRTTSSRSTRATCRR